MGPEGFYANAVRAERPWVSRGTGYRVDTSPRISHSQAPTIATCDRCRDYETNRVVFGCVALGLYDGLNGSHTVWQ
jgi:hypothetical protein